MRILVSTLLCLVVATSSWAQSSTDIRSVGAIGGAGAPGSPEGPDIFCETLNSLIVADGLPQLAESGICIDGNPGTTLVDDGTGDIKLNTENTVGDGIFIVGWFLDVTPAVAPLADEGFTIAFDYEFSDLNTSRFFTPQDANQNIIFSRIGDTDGNGTWDVLETDGLGNGVFIDTGVMIALSGRMEIAINDLALDISIDGAPIYSGGIVGANGDVTPGETLTSVASQTTNDAGGIGSVECIDNISLNMEPCGTGGCGFMIGDVNMDGIIDLLDVAPFVGAITSGFVCEADINEDGVVDLLDVGPFVEILTGG